MSTVTVSEPVEAWVDGRLYRMWVVTEATVGSGDAWSLTGLPAFFTITLFEAKLTTPASATTIDPELGIAQNWTINSLDHVVENDKAAAYVRTPCRVPVSSPSGELHGRSKPNVGAGQTAGEIVTRITIVEGH